MIGFVLVASGCILYWLVGRRIWRTNKLHPLRVNAISNLGGIFLVLYILTLGVYQIHLHWSVLLSGAKSRLIVIFSLYTALIPLFGLLYRDLYRRRRSHFSFASQIAEDQVYNAKEKAASELSDGTAASNILRGAEAELTVAGEHSIITERNELTAKLSSEAQSSLKEDFRASDWFVVVDERSYVAFSTLGGIQTGVHTFLTVRLLGRQLRSYSFGASAPHGVRAIMEHIAEAVLREESQVKVLADRLDSLGSQRPDAWTFVDFLYFSTITQTTVGYGDILPNSSAVRVVVICQILLGYFVIAIMITFTFGH